MQRGVEEITVGNVACVAQKIDLEEPVVVEEVLKVEKRSEVKIEEMVEEVDIPVEKAPGLILDSVTDISEERDSVYSDSESEPDSESSVNSLDDDIDRLLAEADFLMTRKSCIVDDAFTRVDYSKFFARKEGHFALMAMTEPPKQVSSDSTIDMNSDKYCGTCDRLTEENKQLRVQLESARLKCQSNRKEAHEFNKVLDGYKKDISD